MTYTCFYVILLSVKADQVFEKTRNFDCELLFTEIYKKHLNDHKTIREMMCLRVMFPANFMSIKDNDLFAGRLIYQKVGLSLEQETGGPAYYCYANEIESRMKGLDLADEYKTKVKEMISFWDKEATINGKLVSILPEDMLKATTNSMAEGGGTAVGCLPEL